MKKKIIILIAIIMILSVSTIVMYKNNNKEYKIKKILNNKYYSYLPKEAKNYIKEIYIDTGEIIKTEKNKEENKPYLNPNYIEYLSMSSNEKKEIEVIPDKYEVDYNYNKLGNNGELPEQFDLRNVNNQSYITPLSLKNQGGTNLCWAFATTEQVESYLMLKNSQPYNYSTKIFSPRQVDYATSSNGIKDYQNEYGIRELLAPGNFYMASEIMSYGLSLTKESHMPFNESEDTKEVNDILNFNNSVYEVNNTVDLPRISEINNLDDNYNCDNDECINALKEEYIETIKENVMNNGGGVINVTSPRGKCAFKNTDNNPGLSVQSNCYNMSEGHSMHVIGWDDNYTYSYCKGTNKNYSVTNGSCRYGTLTTNTGAFILRNSWGEAEESYVYLGYDSFTIDKSSPTVYFVTDISETSSRTWDNVYSKSIPYEGNIYISSVVEQTYTKKINNQEKLTKVKFNTLTADGIFSITIKDGDKQMIYNNVLTTSLPGIYTIDLSDKNIVLDNDTFTITISNNNSYIIVDSIAVFTSNVDNTPVIETDNNSVTLDTLNNNNYSTRIYSKTKNIPSNEEVTYTLKKNNVDYTSYLTTENNTIAQNDINTIINISESIPNGKYTLTANYKDAKDEIEINIVSDIIEQVNINYKSNNGQDNTITRKIEKNTSYNVEDNTYEKEGYTFKEWNTNSNGNGTSYKVNDIINNIDSDLDLYAIWIPNSYKIKFDSNGGTGTMPIQEIKYDTTSNLNENRYIKEGYSFKEWNTKKDGTGISYQDKKEILNLTSTNNQIINLYAIWTPLKNTITFDANGGEGNPKIQEFYSDEEFQLIENTYTRDEYTFNNWNTKRDGTGTSYNDKEIINNVHNSITLYAQWKEMEKPITSIQLNENNIVLKIKDKKTITATIEPENTTDSKLINWTSSNPSIAAVSNGIVTAKATGNAVIKATTSNGLSASCNVRVKAKTGWYPINNELYYYDDGIMQKGIVEIEGHKYLFGINSGKLYTNGLATITSGEQAGTYLTDQEGKILTGQQTVGKEKYYFDEQGRMQKGIIDVNGERYLYGITSGKLYTNGLATITTGEQAGTYYTNNDGIIQTGWKTIKGEKYYFDISGKMQRGIIDIEGRKYLLGINSGKLYTNGLATITTGEQAGTYLTNEKGIIQTGQKTVGKEKYYFDEQGRMQKGIVEINGKRYLYGINSGKLYTNGLATVTDGEYKGNYITNEIGEIQIGFFEFKNEKYYTNQQGKLLNGVQKIGDNYYLFGIYSFKLYYGLATTPDGKTYYSNNEGILQKGIIIINGKKYEFGNDYSLIK